MKVYDAGIPNGRGREPERLRVGIAEYEVATDGAVLTTSGLGSCVGVALYDDAAEAAGLAHVMLPAAPERTDAKPAKFADAGTTLLVDELERAGASRERLVAKLAGGSDMLDFSNGDAGIGERNVREVRRTLADHGVALVAEDVGGSYGRSLRLESATGALVVRSAHRENTTL